MCYVGQSFPLGIPIPEGPIGAETLDRLDVEFHRAHRTAYGFASQPEPTMLVNLRLSAIGAVARPVMRAIPEGGADPGAALKGERLVHFRETGGAVACRIYERDRLRAGNVIAGPAIVEQMDSTILVPPGASAVAQTSGILVMTLG